MLLVGCTGRGFQPPAPDYTKWYKEGVSQTGIIAARLLNFYCMKDAGYKRKDNLDMCKLGRIGESPVCDGRR